MEGTGPMKSGNLVKLGANSCGLPKDKAFSIALWVTIVFF